MDLVAIFKIKLKSFKTFEKSTKIDFYLRQDDLKIHVPNLQSHKSIKMQEKPSLTGLLLLNIFFGKLFYLS